MVVSKKENFVAVEAGGVGYKIFMAKNAVAALPAMGAQLRLFTYLQHRDDAMTLYGFLSEKELELFEKLISVSGVGPKSAMGIMGVAGADQIVAAVNEGKAELLTRVSGVGKKTAERVVLELKGKLVLSGGISEQTLTLMESDVELEETLTALGFSRAQAKAAISKIDPAVKGFKERLKEALKKSK